MMESLGLHLKGKSMKEDGWDRDPRGNFVMHPLTAFQATEEGVVVCMRIEWDEVKGTRRKKKSVQVYLQAQDALAVGQNLVRVAPRHGIVSGTAQ